MGNRPQKEPLTLENVDSYLESQRSAPHREPEYKVARALMSPVVPERTMNILKGIFAVVAIVGMFAGVWLFGEIFDSMG